MNFTLHVGMDPTNAGRRGWKARIFASLLGIWLFMVPQVMFSTALLAFCDEVGATTPPLIEEEEVHHTGVPPGPLMPASHSGCDPDEVALPHWEELLLHTLHGEVPHQPPRA